MSILCHIFAKGKGLTIPKTTKEKSTFRAKAISREVAIPFAYFWFMSYLRNIKHFPC